jgi:DNA-binding transcriptional MocR family regulator
MSRQELSQLLKNLQIQYDIYARENLSLDMTRGKPSKEQLDLSNPLLELPAAPHLKSLSGEDCRNYGGLDGIIEAKQLFAQYLEVSPEETLIGGNSSLNLMYDTIVRALLYGVGENHKPWRDQGTIKFLCPAPGYDRHFAICADLGIEMITIPMLNNGPDMDEVERLLAHDPLVKGIWVVPKYSNPTGVAFSDEVVDRLCSMKAAAGDFRIFCDNAYAIHDLYDETLSVKNFLAGCKQAKNPDRVYIFGSTSKISFAGAGIAVMAASLKNLAHIKKHMGVQTIGPDKINQLRHVQFFRDMDGFRNHMHKHAAILRPKFEAVDEVLNRELTGKEIAWWNKPKGGYFISLETLPGCAALTASLAEKVGVKLTKAGATFPYGKDPKDSNIRIAPSMPSLQEIKKAMAVVATCVQIAALKQKLE